MPEGTEREVVSTWELLKELGFHAGTNPNSVPDRELEIDFGNLTLSASLSMSRYFQPVVQLTGIIATRRTLAKIDDQLPLELESRELGIAILVWCLDQAGDGEFVPLKPFQFIAEGRLNRGLLPWERERAAYAARPYCSVARQWMRLALRTLGENLIECDAGTVCTFSFDGSALTIRCGEKPIIVAAEGVRWNETYSVKVEKPTSLPTRLMRDPVGISVFDGFLTIGNRRYTLIADDEAIGS